MSFIADLHIHSKYSRATSKDMDIPHLDKAAQMKGLHLVGTGDFTHPVWRSHLRSTLSPSAPGLFKYGSTQFLLSAEVSAIFYRQGKAKVCCDAKGAMLRCKNLRDTVHAFVA